MRARSSSPRAVKVIAVSDVNISANTTQPADMVATLLLNVPACGIASGLRGVEVVEQLGSTGERAE